MIDNTYTELGLSSGDELSALEDKALQAMSEKIAQYQEMGGHPDGSLSFFAEIRNTFGSLQQPDGTLVKSNEELLQHLGLYSFCELCKTDPQLQDYTSYTFIEKLWDMIKSFFGADVKLNKHSPTLPAIHHCITCPRIIDKLRETFPKLDINEKDKDGGCTMGMHATCMGATQGLKYYIEHCGEPKTDYLLDTDREGNNLFHLCARNHTVKDMESVGGRNGRVEIIPLIVQTLTPQQILDCLQQTNNKGKTPASCKETYAQDFKKLEEAVKRVIEKGQGNTVGAALPSLQAIYAEVVASTPEIQQIADSMSGINHEQGVLDSVRTPTVAGNQVDSGNSPSI